MKKDLTVGLVLRKDGRYQRKEMIGGVWKTFSAKTPAEVWGKIADAKEEQGRCLKLWQTNMKSLSPE